MKKQLFLSIIAITFCLIGNSQTCTLTCNLGTSYVCPTSNTWKSNPGTYNDSELMTSLGYSKDNKGCWKLQGSSTKTITGSKSKLKQWYDKLKRTFSTTKTGF
jgi:hypothetical protein